MESFGSAASTDPAPKRSSFFELEVYEPQTYKQVVESIHVEQWLRASKAEYDSQIKNKSWVPIPKSQVPTECAILPHKWVRKYKPDSSLARQISVSKNEGCISFYGDHF
jgi:hypothetical protein